MGGGMGKGVERGIECVGGGGVFVLLVSLFG